MGELDSSLAGWQPGPVTELDALAPGPAEALAAVLETAQPTNDELPPLWHWVYFLDWPPHGALGPDGHPLRGHFLPPIPDRRRMFAGGRLTVNRPLRLGSPAERVSSLAAVTVKQARSGELAFVTVRSEYRQQGELCVTEEQDYAYRCGESGTKDPHPQRPDRAPESDRAWQRGFTADPVRLFRFSALTANAHRIHYDQPYVRGVESYPDLVVHGPLLVLLMTELARAHAGEAYVHTVNYRLRAPVFAGDPMLVTGDPDAGSAGMAVLTAPGTCNAQAEVGFA